MSKEKIREYHDALADILCWTDGYCAAANAADPFIHLNLLALRELKSDLYGKLYGKTPKWIKEEELPFP